MKPGDEFNARGYFENIDVCRLEVSVLRHYDTNRQGKGFQPTDLAPVVPGWRRLVERHLYGAACFYKSTKAPILWRLWHADFPYARWIVVRRPREAVLASFERTPFMDAFSSRVEWDAMLDRYDTMLADIEATCANVFPFEFSNDERRVRDLLRFAGAPSSDPSVLRAVFRPELVHG